MTSSPRYYAVNDRPVKIVELADGGADILVFDWASGTFVPDRDYWEKISGMGVGKDVDQLSEVAFETRVAVLRAAFLDRYAELPIVWEETGEGFVPYQARVANHSWTMRLNDFPEEPLYTLFVDGQEIADLEDWPTSWTRPDAAASIEKSVSR